MSFEELRAKARGWDGRQWVDESKSRRLESTSDTDSSISGPVSVAAADIDHLKLSIEAGLQDTQSSLGVLSGDTAALDVGREEKNARVRRTRVKEVKGETQTSRDFRTSSVAPC